MRRSVCRDNDHAKHHLGALLPMVVTLLLGFVARWHHEFRPKDAWILNRMELLYAVPLALFARNGRHATVELRQDIPLGLTGGDSYD